jgi:hypothetical protein
MVSTHPNVVQVIESIWTEGEEELVSVAQIQRTVETHSADEFDDANQPHENDRIEEAFFGEKTLKNVSPKKSLFRSQPNNPRRCYAYQWTGLIPRKDVQMNISHGPRLMTPAPDIRATRHMFCTILVHSIDKKVLKRS